MMASFEGLLQILEECFPKLSGNDEPSQHAECTKKRLVFLGEFEIDKREEWACLIGGLIMLQLKSLATLLERLNGFASGRKWDTQRLMLNDVERQVNATANKLRHIRLLL